MGVPALFRWLSKKYPKIILTVEEEDEDKITDDAGNEIAIPVNMSSPNPNGVEFDNLYLDMNGLVHPCTHPEGKPAPETEEEMMVEIFNYTERVVNMVRPRKLLFMAIDGVAPRAKMNQQRSRRFRSAQEAKDKEEARKESLKIWEAMGKEVPQDEHKEAWDSNAITPGTPFMDLLASSLRYWVVHKINTDSGWKNIQVLISDASVPGEGEHKIMDFIRRQRTNPGHDPNTRHVIYGLDADLIMLGLATHEPNFRVLREDVFANDTKPDTCRMCGQQGHYAAQCTGTKAEIEKKPSDKKPFIFLDVSILREYLEVELDVSTCPIPFNLEQAIDDWVLLIFFVGNDFLPHLPSLEIREGAIDTLLKIWKQELPRMGGYLTNHGEINLARAQIILEGLAKREDDIFRRRREAEERQDQNAKRRKLENQIKNGTIAPSAALGLTSGPTAPAHPSLPPRPDFAAKADSIGLGAAATPESLQMAPLAAQALAGSNRDVVANRRAIRMANMSAAEVLKAELAGLQPVKPSASSLPPKPVVASATAQVTAQLPAKPISSLIGSPTNSAATTNGPSVPNDEMDVDEFGRVRRPELDENAVTGHKRSFDEGPGAPDVEEDIVTVEENDDDDVPPDADPLAFKVNADGTVTQQDTVKLWEPGYKERYYKQKFGVEPNDVEFRNKVAQSYIEGLCWVLKYYYQGTPSWQWYYPYHFSPFAADLVGVEKMTINFKLGQPFKPFEQLMGVFPAASRKHIPEVFHRFMVDEDSSIIDFYPSTFQIDMNGKRMAWQGVALLPFIDEKRLLEAMALEYPNLPEEEKRRNKWGDNVMFAGESHPVYPFYESLYGKKKKNEAVPLDPKDSGGISGSVMPNPDCVPGSTYFSHFTEEKILKEYDDVKNDRSLSVLYYFPKQLSPHRSVLLPGVRRPARVLQANDLEITRNGGRGRGRGGFHSDRGGRGGYGDRNRNDPFHGRSNNYTSGGPSSSYGGSRGGYTNGRGSGTPGGPPGRGGYGGGRGGHSYPSSSYSNPRSSYPPPPNYDGYGGGGAHSGPPTSYGGYGSGPTPSRGGPPSHNYHGRNDDYGGYDGGHSGYGGYGNSQGSFGGQDDGQGGGYGGYGVNTGGGYGNPSGYGRRGGSFGQGRGGRGRGGYY